MLTPRRSTRRAQIRCPLMERLGMGCPWLSDLVLVEKVYVCLQVIEAVQG